MTPARARQRVAAALRRLATGVAGGLLLAAAPAPAAPVAPAAQATAAATAVRSLPTTHATRAGSATAIVLADDTGVPLALAAPARRIVSLLPSITETLCALQACDRLVGIDRHADWPAEVNRLPRLGGLEDLQVERIVALRPDLVLVAGSARGVQRLRAMGLPVLALEPQSLDDTRRVIDVLARALGRPEAGDALWRSLQARVDAAAARVPPAWQGRRVYVEVASSPYAAGEASFVGALLARLHLRNIVPAALGPFPLLNPEMVVRAQPEVVIAEADALAAMPARPGWAALAGPGVRTCPLRGDGWNALVRPGPRLADAAERIADCLAAAPSAAAGAAR